MKTEKNQELILILAKAIPELGTPNYQLLRAARRAELTVEAAMTGGQNLPPVVEMGPQARQLFELDKPLRDARDEFEKAYFEFHLANEGGSMTRVADKTGLTLDQLAQRVDTLIVTRGAEGSWVHHGGQRHRVAPVAAAEVKDPTGCGDAYRAGLLLALAKGVPLIQGAQLGSVLGAIKIAVQGCQNHQPSLAQIRASYESHYGAWPF